MSGIGGAGMLLPILSRFGWKGIVIGLILMAVIYGGGLLKGGGSSSTPQQKAVNQPQDEQVQFIGYVFDDAQAFFSDELSARGTQYQEAKLVVFTGATESGCGTGSASVGPFYCPLDRKVYIDVSFYQQLSKRFGAPGDFAQAYVIAHEVGHHIQNLRGGLQQREDQKSAILVELQADCLAGVWAHSAERRGLVEVGDVDEALRAAASVGDDAIQRRETGYVRPESWTHGSAEQRKNAFDRGYRGGDLDRCSPSSLASR